MSPCSSRWRWAAADWRNPRKCPSSDRAPRQDYPSGSLCLTRTRRVFNNALFTGSFIDSNLGNIKCQWAGFIDVKESKKHLLMQNFKDLVQLKATLAVCKTDPEFCCSLGLQSVENVWFTQPKWTNIRVPQSPLLQLMVCGSASSESCFYVNMCRLL